MVEKRINPTTGRIEYKNQPEGYLQFGRHWDFATDATHLVSAWGWMG